jgi:hypothetical protein
VPDPVWQAAAVVVALAHLAVVLFLVAGGFVARHRRPLLCAHLAVVAAVVAVSVAQEPCPLTELELRLRELGGVPPYRGGFVEHYLVRPVHPAGLTPAVSVLVHALAVAVNVVAYAGLGRRPAATSQPAGVAGDTDGVDAVAGAGLADGVRQVVPHGRG